MEKPTIALTRYGSTEAVETYVEQRNPQLARMMGAILDLHYEGQVTQQDLLNTDQPRLIIPYRTLGGDSLEVLKVAPFGPNTIYGGWVKHPIHATKAQQAMRLGETNPTPPHWSFELSNRLNQTNALVPGYVVCNEDDARTAFHVLSKMGNVRAKYPNAASSEQQAIINSEQELHRYLCGLDREGFAEFGLVMQLQLENLSAELSITEVSLAINGKTLKITTLGSQRMNKFGLYQGTDIVGVIGSGLDNLNPQQIYSAIEKMNLGVSFESLVEMIRQQAAMKQVYMDVLGEDIIFSRYNCDSLVNIERTGEVVYSVDPAFRLGGADSPWIAGIAQSITEGANLDDLNGRVLLGSSYHLMGEEVDNLDPGISVLAATSEPGLKKYIGNDTRVVVGYKASLL